MKKQILAIALAVVTVMMGISFVNSAEAASRRPSLGRQIRRDVDRIYRNQVRSEARNRAYQEIRRAFRYTDPNSRESRELRAKSTLLGLPVGNCIVQCDPSMQNTIVNLVNRDPDLTLFECRIAKSKNGKRLGLLVTRYSCIEEMLG